VSHISVVIPVYNEQDCVPEMFRRLEALPKAPGDQWEYVFVDDGSRDRTLTTLRELSAASPRLRYVSFSRNFGHEAALTAGLDHATGDAVITLDGDLQHPPELIPRLIEEWKAGNQVVYARRESSKHLPPLKAFLSRWFYRAIRRGSRADIPADTANFRLMDRRVVAEFRRLRERARFGRGLVAWTGFRQAFVPYKEDERFAGGTKYTTWQSAGLAANAFIAFTDVPLRAGRWLCAAFGAISAALTILAVALWICEGSTPAAYIFLLACVFLVGGATILSVSLVGVYVGQIFRQSQGRPIYIVGEKSPALPSGPEGAASETRTSQQ
jgi:polyisoprenyl-phosphate glycosyltransferase